MKRAFLKILALFLGGALTMGEIPSIAKEGTEMLNTSVAINALISGLYNKGNYASGFTPISRDSKSWRDGFVSGNGLAGYVTSGEPYSDTFVFQNMYFNFPSAAPRVTPAELTGQLEEARENVFKLNDRWQIKDANGNRRRRTYYYSYHPGAQLRLTSSGNSNAVKDYVRWTNYETAETGVRYTDSNGQWERRSFTSRPDDVSITKISKSSGGKFINMQISMDKIGDMAKAGDGFSEISKMKYKSVVPDDCSYIAQIAHYPSYEGSELYDGGYCTVTYIVAEGTKATKSRKYVSSDEGYFAEDKDGNKKNYYVNVANAEAVYLITATDRTFNMTGGTLDNAITKFVDMESYPLLEELVEKTKAVKDKHTAGNKFSYENALAASAEIQRKNFNNVSFELAGDEEYAAYDNIELINNQRETTDKSNHEFMRRAYDQARYAQICCGGSSAPRLYGMWTGEWNPGWRSIYTLDANVNLQVSSMNTANLGEDFQYGYITYFLRHSYDFMQNAKNAYGMHDAIQLSVNTDADGAMHVEYDNAYPFEYWNAGASWCLLPIFEYWQCYGNKQIPINDNMRFDENLQKVLGVNDGGLTDEEFNAIKARGWLDLESDILLPLLTKQANFWEQIVTPRYYTDAAGKAYHDENKTALNEDEKYIIIPTYSPENHPIGYNSTITANATMDIAAARDGLDMVCTMEKTVKRDGWQAAVKKWENLKNNISDYKYDVDGALREWAMDEYTENNNHRHLSHLYVAWPAYDTQNDPELANAANIALDNRNKYNTDDATAGHGWMHKALVEARLKRGDGMMKSLLQMMTGTAYYSSLMTDHDTNRRNDTYCTDTAFGTLGAVNEAMLFSNTGQIEIVPALPSDWKRGSVKGLMARTMVTVSDITWDIDNKTASVTMNSSEDNNVIRLSCGEAWTEAKLGGAALQTFSDANGKYVEVTLAKGVEKTVNFTLSDTPNGMYTIKNGSGKYLKAGGIYVGDPAVWGELDTGNKYAYWTVENTVDGKIIIRSTATGKYLKPDGKGGYVLAGDSDRYEWQASRMANGFTMTHLDFALDVDISPDKFVIEADGKEVTELKLGANDKVKLNAVVEPAASASSITWMSDSIGNGVVAPDGTLAAYAPGVFNVTAKVASDFTENLKVTVSDNGMRDVEKAEVVNVTGSDGFNQSFALENLIDGIAGTSYSSKDDSTKKYICAELEKEKSISLIYVIGRTETNRDGLYANRINGAKVYASDAPINADNINTAVLVGEVNGVTATREYVPARVEIDTKGREYKYYALCLDNKNNGNNISMAVDDVAFYTGGKGYEQKKIEPVNVRFEGGDSAEYNPKHACDGNVETVFDFNNSGDFANQYIGFDFGSRQFIDKMVVKRTNTYTLNKNTTYWADHAYSSGCVFEGSIDGSTWEAIYTMNINPDGMDNMSEVVITPNSRRAYRYIRYIRTENNPYIKWAPNSGNKLLLADVEFYTTATNAPVRILDRTDKSVTVRIKGGQSGEFNLIVAVYDSKGCLIESVKTPVTITAGMETDVEVAKEKDGNIRLFVWDDNMKPLPPISEDNGSN